MTGEDRKAYSPERLDEAVREMTELAEQEDVQIALCGGLAMQSYGSDRLTKDVDLVADGTIRAIVPVRQLSFGGVGVFAPNGVPVDLIVRDDDAQALYDEALERAVSRPGVPCRVVSAEHLAAMKLAAGRGRDLLDLFFLVNAPGVLDLEKARDIVRRHLGWYAGRDFDTKVEDAKIEAERERRSK